MLKSLSAPASVQIKATENPDPPEHGTTPSISTSFQENVKVREMQFVEEAEVVHAQVI